MATNMRVDKDSQPALFLALREPEAVQTNADVCVAMLDADLVAFGVIHLKRPDAAGLTEDTAVLRAIAEGAAAAYREVCVRVCVCVCVRERECVCACVFVCERERARARERERDSE